MSSLCDKSFDRSFAPHQNNEKKSFVLFCRMLVTNDKNDIRKMRKALWACVKCSFANTSRAYCAFLHAFVRFGTIFLWFTQTQSADSRKRFMWEWSFQHTNANTLCVCMHCIYAIDLSISSIACCAKRECNWFRRRVHRKFLSERCLYGYQRVIVSGP